MQVRSFVEKDLSVLVKLLNETNRGAYEFTPVTENDVRSRIKEGRFRTLMVEEKGDVVGSVTYNDGFWGEEIRWLAVSNRPDRQLIENMLVTEAERFVHGETVFTSIDAESPRINDWIERGYLPEGGLYQMTAKLESVRAIPKVSEGIVIRSMVPGEEMRVVEMVNAVFARERLKSDFVEKGKSEFPPFDEKWVHLAEFMGRVLAVVVSWPAANHNSCVGARRGYLGPAATVPEYRGKKLASVLTVRAMNFLFSKGMTEVVLHTSELNVPSVALLRNLGFEVGHHWRFMRKNLSPKN